MHHIFIICVTLFVFMPAASLRAAATTGVQKKPELRWQGHWKGEGLREKLVLEVLEDFQYLHQDIDVKFSFAADILPEKSTDQQARFIADMIQSGTISWNVIWLDSNIYQSVAKLLNDPFWGKQYLVDFSNVRKVRDAHRPELLQDPDFCKSTGSILTGPYIEGFLYSLWYNTEVAGQLGLTVRENEMSFDDLIGYLGQVNNFNQTAEVPISAVVDFKKSGSVPRLAHNLFLSENPAPFSDVQVQSALLKVLTALETIGTLHPTQYNPDDISWTDAARILEENKGLFLIDSTWRYNSIQQFSPGLTRKMRPVQMPGFQKQDFYCGGFIPTWAVMKDSPMKEDAIKLMEFWCNPEVIEKWTRYTKSPSGIIGSFYDPEYGNDPVAVYQRNLIHKRVLLPDFFMQQERYPAIQSLIPLITRLITGEITAEKAFQELEARLP